MGQLVTNHRLKAFQEIDFQFHDARVCTSSDPNLETGLQNKDIARNANTTKAYMNSLQECKVEDLINSAAFRKYFQLPDEESCVQKTDPQLSLYILQKHKNKIMPRKLTDLEIKDINSE